MAMQMRIGIVIIKHVRGGSIQKCCVESVQSQSRAEHARFAGSCCRENDGTQNVPAFMPAARQHYPNHVGNGRARPLVGFRAEVTIEEGPNIAGEMEGDGVGHEMHPGHEWRVGSGY
ncbi:hypothetical protein D3C80_560560 [compost metagenome]